jgi:hypothetical protein
MSRCDHFLACADLRLISTPTNTAVTPAPAASAAATASFTLRCLETTSRMLSYTANTSDAEQLRVEVRVYFVGAARPPVSLVYELQHKEAVQSVKVDVPPGIVFLKGSSSQLIRLLCVGSIHRRNARFEPAQTR